MYSQTTIDWLNTNEYDVNDIDKVGKYGNSAIMKAVREANCDVTKELIENKANLEIKNIDGNTALWNACFGGSYECVKLLVENGINLDSVNDNGVTSLMYCASAGKTDMVKVLLDFGANKDIENLDGFRAIDLVANRNIYKLLKG